MHKSRLAGFIIDCRTDDLDGAASFWAGALGLAVRRSPLPAEAAYIALDTAPGDPHLEVQKVGHPSRVHIDIEADDVEAEAARLEQLGARKLEKVKTWWVMEAPTGHRFCVIQAERAGFDEKANVWD